MYIDDFTIHLLISDVLNQNESLSETEVLLEDSTKDMYQCKVLSAELGKIKKSYRIKISIEGL